MRAEMARGAAWMVLFRLFDRSIGIVSTVVLARLLLPADFGVVAMAMSFIAVVELATAFSFEIALIQKPDPQREHFDSAWTLNIMLALVGAAVTAALAIPAARFYDDPRLVAVMWCIAAAWVVSGFENTGIANFRRRMDFVSEFRFMASKRVITFVATMAMAFAFHSYWALVVGTIAGRLVGVALSYAMEPFRPRPDLSRARELLSFSGWLLANNIAGVILTRLPHLFVGRHYGAQTLGVYTIGSEVAQLAHTELVAPINRAMFPGYARLAGDLDAFRRVCADATAAILLVVLPASLAIAVFAQPIVRILLGSRWYDAVPLIQILAFVGAVAAITSSNTAAYLALGRPRVATFILFVRVVLLLAMISWAGIGTGAQRIAYAELIASIGSLAVSLPTLFSVVRMRPGEYFASFWRPSIASAAAAAIVHQLVVSNTPRDIALSDAIAQLAVGLPMGMAIYLLMLRLLWSLAGRPEAAIEVVMGLQIRAAIGSALGSAPWRRR